MFDERVMVKQYWSVLGGIAIVASAASIGCSSGGGDTAPIEVTSRDARAPGAPLVPSWDEFKAAARQRIRGNDVYVVETDTLLDDLDDLWGIYAERYLDAVDKSIVNVVGGARDLRSTPRDIRYCFAAGWGQAINCPGTGCYTAPALSGVKTSIQDAMASWEQKVNLRFVYMNNLDGAGCSTSGSNPGVDFVVQHYQGSSTAFGPFPSNSWANQQLLVPTSGISRLLAIHEVGHAIGLRHEHIHSGASPRCDESGTREELTSFDTLSCMKYSDCTAGNFINGTEISALDGIGARKLYGAPARWLPTYDTNLF